MTSIEELSETFRHTSIDLMLINYRIGDLPMGNRNLLTFPGPDPCWRRKASINKDTGDIYYRYFYKRTLLKRIPIRSRRAIKLAGYVLIERDLRLVATWLKQLDQLQDLSAEEATGPYQLVNDETHDDSVETPLFVAAVTFYGKCFTTCEGRRVKLEAKNLDSRYARTHKEVMELRHKYTAHSGATKYEEVEVALVLPPKKLLDSEGPKLMRELKQFVGMTLGPESPQSFLALAEHARALVIDKIDQINNEIWKNEINPKGLSYWYKKSR